LAFVESRKLFGGRDMKKYSWIVALLLALSVSALFISCGAAFDATKLDPKPWTIEAKDIKLEVIGSNPGTSVDGNKFINKAGGGASSAGFVWKVPTGPNEDGFVWTDFEKVRVTIKILDLKQPVGGVSYNAKASRGMNPDVNKIGLDGKQSTKQYDNATIALADDEEGYSDYPVSEFKGSGEIAFQYNCWEEEPSILVGGGRTTPNHTVEVSFMFFTKLSEPAFVPVTGIELDASLLDAKKPNYTYADIVLKATVTPANATNKDIIWAIFPMIAIDGSGKITAGVEDPKNDTKLKSTASSPYVYPGDYDNTSDDFKSETTLPSKFGPSDNLKDSFKWKSMGKAEIPHEVTPTEEPVWPWPSAKTDVTNKQGRAGFEPDKIIVYHIPEKNDLLGYDGKTAKINLVAVVKGGKADGSDYIQKDLILTVTLNPTGPIEFDEAVSPAKQGGFDLGAIPNQWSVNNSQQSWFGGGNYDLLQTFMLVVYAPGGVKFNNDNGVTLATNSGGTLASGGGSKLAGGKKELAVTDENDFVYIVFDTTKFSSYADFLAAKTAGEAALSTFWGWGLQFQLDIDAYNLYPLCKGYLIKNGVTLTKDSSATSVDLDGGVGFITSKKPVGLTLTP